MAWLLRDILIVDAREPAALSFRYRPAVAYMHVTDRTATSGAVQHPFCFRLRASFELFVYVCFRVLWLHVICISRVSRR